MKTLTLLAAFFLVLASALQADTTIYDIPLVDIEGNETTLEKYKGKTLLIVNVASKCGYTRQYKGLEELNEKYANEGLVVLGFPCNQFGGQEPGTEEDIMEFCSLTYGVSFPMFSKIEVNGPNRHPLYEKLAGEESPFPGQIGWNFSKFLVNGEGEIVERFSSAVAPKSDKMISAIEMSLAGS
ncbi:glutathione peroxidase [Pelagicoccus sp. SDUM812002]|uniref:glutathione peroxidase n=1 Tax=Pelagicoccus sp. SDUM812002 TaxID=3041266 RepID=UPI00280D60DC|nr:glutathione peroxidase [Pelagicoccus sp. SDUM812002]MDQ8186014.1 glutathione peroxidase [Pelagicoccus sp. SDUM812002]